VNRLCLSPLSFEGNGDGGSMMRVIRMRGHQSQMRLALLMLTNVAQWAPYLPIDTTRTLWLRSGKFYPPGLRARLLMRGTI
jgi:hypothetical protein